MHACWYGVLEIGVQAWKSSVQACKNASAQLCKQASKQANNRELRSKQASEQASKDGSKRVSNQARQTGMHAVTPPSKPF